MDAFVVVFHPDSVVDVVDDDDVAVDDDDVAVDDDDVAVDDVVSVACFNFLLLPCYRGCWRAVGSR